MRPNYVLQRTPGTSLVSTYLRGPAPLNTALDHRLAVRELVKFVGFVAFLGGLLFGVEALLLGPSATPERIAEYHFGSEARPTVAARTTSH